MSLSEQAKNIEILRADPSGNYLLSGDAGTGKTHFSMALLRHATMRWTNDIFYHKDYPRKSIFRVNAKQILDEHHQWTLKKEGDNTREPEVTQKNIKALAREGFKVSLFIDEIDKFGPTKFRIDTLLELAGAVDETKGQLVAVSNASMVKLQQLWAGFDSADAILRRFAGREASGQNLEFHKE